MVNETSYKHTERTHTHITLRSLKKKHIHYTERKCTYITQREKCTHII
jgi:hypothetical protein